ncbi:MAG: hypothetical protein COA42_19830 [Alteromonadaceae bacterium]|nr:MAG: hypothetical protein COA42_19830 [Alteromonadaceae bacterium]
MDYKTFSGFTTTLFATTILSLSSLASADEVARPLDYSKQWLFHTNVESLSIDDAVAQEQGVDSSAAVVNFEGEYFFTKSISSNMGIGVIIYDDKNSFSQQTESRFGGDRDNSSSDARAFPVFVDVGYKKFFGSETPAYATVRAGVATLLASERAIGNCSNCRSEDIDIDAGAYVLVGTGVNFSSFWGLGIHYKQYVSGDLENAFGLNATFMY